MLLRTATILTAVMAVFFMAVAAGDAAAAVEVAEGDTLGAIAANHGTTVEALATANGIRDPNIVRIGQKLKLPGGARRSTAAKTSSRYTVVVGDTLSAIAARHGTTLAAVVSANGIANPNIVVLGASLRIPGASAAAAPSKTTVKVRRHRVRAGETLAAIAARFGSSPHAIAASNGIVNQNLIVTGNLLKIPRGPKVGLPPAQSTGIDVVARTPAGVPKEEVRRLLDRHSARHGVDSHLTRAIAWQESGFQQTVVSHTGAVGVMQLMPGTAQWIGRDLLGRTLDPRDVNDNVEGGVAFLKWLDARADSREEAIAGYYQGLRSVRTRGLYDDTEQYVRSVVALTGSV